MLYREHACSGEEVQENVVMLYLDQVAHVRAPLATLIERIEVVLEGETGYFQFLLIPLLAIFIQGLKVAHHASCASPGTTGICFCPPRGVTRTS